MEAHQNILIIGAGLCGSLLALRMAQRGHRVQLIEKRPDLRRTKLAAGRSINLAFSNRGAKAMRLAGIEEQVKSICIPMHGRMIHEKNGHTFLSPYSGLADEYINSISRPGLNALLLDEAEKMPNVAITFNLDCVDVDLENATARFKKFNTDEVVEKSGDIIIGTDGAGSVVRKTMFLKRDFLFNFTQNFLQHGYKELYIPAGESGAFLLEKNALHIWPRGENMIIALPNPDGSFTVTLFMSFKTAQHNFENLNTVEKVTAYFEEYYPDALAVMPNLDKLFFENPTSPLGLIKCSPWHYAGKTLLMGDSAHAIVPFYGQGMNASFEDITVFDEILDDNLESWEAVFEAYEKRRKIDTDAISELSLDNFHEMKEATASPLFQRKRKLETAFEKEHPELYSGKYRLVTFQEQIGYHEAMKRGRAQDKALLKLLAEGEISDELTDLTDKIALVKTTSEQLLKKDLL